MTIQWFDPTGPSVPALAALDDAMRAFMTAGDIRGGVIAVVHAGRLVYARGYTYAEPGYRTTMPTDLFRIASTTKPLTSMMIYKLIEGGQLAMTDKVQSILGLTAPGGGALTFDPMPADKQTDGRYFNAITVEHLLRHQGGWYHGADWTFHGDAQIAQVYGVDLPITKYHVASQAAANKLAFYPGYPTLGQDTYSNLGYNLLGMVIEKKLVLSYAEAVRQRLFAPLGITRPRMSKAALEDRAPGEVEYHFVPPTTVQSVVHKDRRLVPEQYGGENNYNFDAFGGWLMAAPDYARVLAAFMQRQIPPMPNVAFDDMLTWSHWTRANNVRVNDHGGVVGGACSYVAARSDGNGLVIFINKSGMSGTYNYDGSTWNIGDYEPFHRILDGVASWPAHDMFPALLGGAPDPDVFYDGVWSQSTADQFVSWGKTPAQHNALYGERWNSGFRLIHQQAIVRGNQVTYDGIWSPNSGGQFVSWGKTPAQHSALYGEWWNKGFRLIHQQAYVVGGQVLYDGIWNPNTGGQFVSWGKTLAQHTALYDQWWNNGFRLIHQQAYVVGGQVLYDGIWNPNTGGQFVTWGKTLDQMRVLYGQQWQNGFKLIHVQSYKVGTQVLYDGIWQPDAHGQFVTWSVPPNLFEANYAVEWPLGMRLIGMNARLR